MSSEARRANLMTKVSELGIELSSASRFTGIRHNIALCGLLDSFSAFASSFLVPRIQYKSKLQ